MLPFDVGEIAGDAPGDAGGGVRGSGGRWSEEKGWVSEVKVHGTFALFPRGCWGLHGVNDLRRGWMFA